MSQTNLDLPKKATGPVECLGQTFPSDEARRDHYLKLLAQKLKDMGLDSVLVITDSLDENLLLASRNLPHVLICEPRHADPVSLVHYKKILITKAALAKIEEMLA